MVSLFPAGLVAARIQCMATGIGQGETAEKGESGAPSEPGFDQPRPFRGSVREKLVGAGRAVS